jgi:hypothetical protein
MLPTTTTPAAAVAVAHPPPLTLHTQRLSNYTFTTDDAAVNNA